MKEAWETNRIGVLAFTFTIVGVVTTIVPFLGFIAFFALPTGLVLGIIALAKKKQPKWLGVSSILVSSVTIVCSLIITLLFIVALTGILYGTQ